MKWFLNFKENLKKSKIIVDIHKYGIQDGLTFRVFEAIGYHKKLITTNKDIKTYDFIGAIPDIIEGSKEAGIQKFKKDFDHGYSR